jgi:FMN-dependent NADH-azoreductase
MTLFRLDASINPGEGSRSRRLADLVQDEWAAAHPDDAVIRRDLGRDPVPAGAWSAAVSAAMQPGDPSPEQREAVALAAGLADELVAADALVFAVPLYNFGVSQHFKAWVDLVVTDPRMAAGGEPATAGKPAVLATARGGSYAAGTPREGWDHATPWMRRILEDVWGLDLLVVECELTLVGVNPALDQFADLARDLWAAADHHAAEHGRTLAARTRQESRSAQAAADLASAP